MRTRKKKIKMDGGILVCTSVTQSFNIFCNIHHLRTTVRLSMKLLRSLLSNQKGKTNRSNCMQALITRRIRLLTERTKAKD